MRKLPVVQKLVARSTHFQRDAEKLRFGERVLSQNAIAGPTVSVPIAASCQPTRLCAADCYAASNTQATPAALAKQFRVQHSIEADPAAFAARVASEYDAAGLDFLRWNGVGDLTEPAVEAINALIRKRPDIPLWIVTRIPRLAASIAHGKKAFVHFSLDRSSMDRRKAFLAHDPRSKNYFFSYQCERDELVPNSWELGVSVIFYRRYQPTPGADLDDPAVCPLNLLADREGACAACRRCFDGTAVAMRAAHDPPHKTQEKQEIDTESSSHA